MVFLVLSVWVLAQCSFPLHAFIHRLPMQVAGGFVGVAVVAPHWSRQVVCACHGLPHFVFAGGCGMVLHTTRPSERQ